MNSYHLIIKLTIESNLSKFLDTKITWKENDIKCFTYHRDNKLPSQWTYAEPRNYEKNAIVGELHCTSKINSELEQEIPRIRANS